MFASPRVPGLTRHLAATFAAVALALTACGGGSPPAPTAPSQAPASPQAVQPTAAPLLPSAVASPATVASPTVSTSPVASPAGGVPAISSPTPQATVALPAASPSPAAAPAASPAASPAAQAGGTPPVALGGPVPAGKNFTVGIAQFVTHPALDASREGAVKALTDAGFTVNGNLKLDVQNGAGDIPTMTTIAQKFRDSNVDLVICIGTPPLQAAANVFKDSKTPVLFNAVTDPYAAKVAESATNKPANITGIQALAPTEDAMAVMMQVVPNAKKVGIIFNPAEANSVVATGFARDSAKKLNIELLEATVTKSDEVLQAAQSLLARGADAFFISTDSTVVTGLEALVKVAQDNKKPLFGNDTASARRGAVTALGLDYFGQGYQSGAFAARILKGESAASIPIERANVSSLAVNTKAAELQGVTIPAAVLSRATDRFTEITSQ